MSAINAMILLTTSSLELHDIVPVWKAKENTPIRFQGFLHPQRPRACLIASHEFACPTCQQEAKLRATMMIEEHGHLASSSYVTFRFSAEHNEFGVRALSNRKTLASRLGKLVQQLFPQSFNVQWSENILPDGAELRVWSTRQKLISLISGTRARNIANRYSGLPFQ